MSLTLCARCNSLVPFIFRVGFKAAFVFGDLCLRTSLGMYLAPMVYVGGYSLLCLLQPFVLSFPLRTLFTCFILCVQAFVGVGTLLWLVTCAACLFPLIDDPALRGRRFLS